MKKALVIVQVILMVIYVIPQCAFAEPIIFPTDFNKAMISDSNDIERYNKFRIETPHKELMALIEQQYYQFQKNVKNRNHIHLKIPKIIHQIWIGPLPFPQEARAWQETWSTLHPDWEYKLWTNEDVEQLDFENKKYFDEAKNWGEKADILRYEILYRYGGLYVDVDFACLKSESLDWLNHACDFYTGIHMVRLLLKNTLRINNGLIAARPHHPLMAHAREQIQYFRDKGSVAARTGPDFFTSVIEDILPTSLRAGSVDMVFPSNFFYPSGPKGGPGYKIKAGQAYVQPETIAIHYYTAYWIIKPKKKGANNIHGEGSVSEDNGAQDSKPLSKKLRSDPAKLALRYQQYKQRQNAH